MILFIFFWGLEVNKNILICTAASTTASYWFESKPSYHPTWKSFRWAITYSLGGIAMGSAIVAAIETIFCVVEYMKRHEGNKYVKKVLECLQCVLVCLKKCAEYINNYVSSRGSLRGRGVAAFPPLRQMTPPRPPRPSRTSASTGTRSATPVTRCSTCSCPRAPPWP